MQIYSKTYHDMVEEREDDDGNKYDDKKILTVSILMSVRWGTIRSKKKTFWRFR